MTTTIADALLIGAAVILSLILAVICMVGLWALWGPQHREVRENIRLSRMQRVVRWLGRHQLSKRIL